MPSTSFCIGSKFWFRWAAWPLGAVSTLIYSILSVTCLPCTLSLPELPYDVGPLECCAHRYHKYCIASGLCISSAVCMPYCPIGLMKYKVKDKVKNFRKATAEHLNQVFLSIGAL